MKASHTGSIVSTIIAIGLATASCGVSSSSNKATAKSAEPAGTNLRCDMMYYDSGIQKDPLYSESFDVQVPVISGVTKMFGVTPDTSDYYASVRPNVGEPTQVALTLGRASTQIVATTYLETKTTANQWVILQVSSARSFTLFCAKK
jgi:hypothetical protein